MKEGDLVKISGLDVVWELHYSPLRQPIDKKGLVTLSREVNGKTLWRRIPLERIEEVYLNEGGDSPERTSESSSEGN